MASLTALEMVMPSHLSTLQAAFDSQDLDTLVALLDERVVWRGLADNDHEHVGHGQDQHGAADPNVDADMHDPLPLCTSRDEVRAVFEQFMANGGTGHPIVLAENGDSLVVDPRPEPPVGYPLHQGFTFRGDRIVLIQDYPDRASALADLEV